MQIPIKANTLTAVPMVLNSLSNGDHFIQLSSELEKPLQNNKTHFSDATCMQATFYCKMLCLTVHVLEKKRNK